MTQGSGPAEVEKERSSLGGSIHVKKEEGGGEEVTDGLRRCAQLQQTEYQISTITSNVTIDISKREG